MFPTVSLKAPNLAFRYLVSICSDTRQEALADEYARKLARLTRNSDLTPSSTVPEPTIDDDAAEPPAHPNMGEMKGDTQPPPSPSRADDIHFDDVELDDELLPM
jgi:hypothetical protein